MAEDMTEEEFVSCVADALYEGNCDYYRSLQVG